MPSPIERRIWIMKIVHERKRITMAELNEEFSRTFDDEHRIPPTTFKRDLFEIGRSFNIYIEGVKQRQDSYYYMVNPDDFDEGSITRLMVDRISDTLQVNAVVRKSKELGCVDFGERVQLEAYPSGEKHLSTILNAIKDNAVIRFSYQGFWDDEEEYVLLQPYFVKMSLRRWYVVGLRSDNNEMDSFCLDRIQQLAQTTERFKFPSDFDVKNYFRYSYGALIEKDIEVETVKIKVWEEQVKYLRSLPIHRSQKEIETASNYSIFQFRIRPTYDFKMEILSHGSSWEVLSPAWFRKDVASGFRMGYRLYYVDGRENNSDECQQMRELLTAWKNDIVKYSNSDSIEFIDDIANPREPKIGLLVNRQYSAILGYNDMDKLYFGIRFEDAKNKGELTKGFNAHKLKKHLELSEKGWYGWHKTTSVDALNEFRSILIEILSSDTAP